MTNSSSLEKTFLAFLFRVEFVVVGVGVVAVVFTAVNAVFPAVKAVGVVGLGPVGVVVVEITDFFTGVGVVAVAALTPTVERPRSARTCRSRCRCLCGYSRSCGLCRGRRFRCRESCSLCQGSGFHPGSGGSCIGMIF